MLGLKKSNMNLSLKNRLLFVFVLIIPIPVFFNLNGSLYLTEGLDLNAFALPFSVIFLILITVLQLKSFFILIRKSSKIFNFFIFFQVIVFLLYTLFYDGNGDPLLLLISLLPLFLSYNIGNHIALNFTEEKITDTFKKSILIISFFAGLHALASIQQYGLIGSFANRGVDNVFGFFSIYQKLVYYPTILAFYFLFSLYIKTKLGWVASLILLIDILIIGSRESTLIAVLSLFTYFLWMYLNGQRKYIPILIIFSTSVILFSLQYLGNVMDKFKDSTLLNKLKALENDDISAGRFDMIKKVVDFDNGDYSFLLGNGYSTISDILSPHNQYLEFMVRSGGLSFCFFLFIIIKTLFRIKSNFKINIIKENKIYFVFSCALILFSIVSFNVNTPVRAPFPGILFGFIFGYVRLKNKILCQ